MAKNVVFDESGGWFRFRMKEGVIFPHPIELRIHRSSGVLEGHKNNKPFHVARPYHGANIRDLMEASEVLNEILPGMHIPSMGLGAHSSAADANRPLVNTLEGTTRSLCESLLVVADGLDEIGAGDLARPIRKRESNLRKQKI